MHDFDDVRGLSYHGYDILADFIPDFFEDAPYIGRYNTGIIDLYMLAFKLAQKQLKVEN